MRFRAQRSTASAPPPEEVAPAPRRMRAVVLDGPGSPAALHTADVSVPEPIMDEVLVRVVAAGVNPVDAQTRHGEGVSAQIGAYPAPLGFDFSGVVVSAPYEAHPTPPGTPVFGMTAFPRVGGSYADYVVASSHAIAVKPPRLSHVEAAAVPLAALTAWQLVVDTARTHAGQRILIHAGAGGVGHFAVQLASHFGAHVTTTCSTRNLSWMRELGADVAIDHTTTRFEEVVPPVDVVIDLVGNAHDRTGSRSLAVLRPGGLLVTVPTAGWTRYAEEAADAGVSATSFRVTPDGVTLATIARLLESGELVVYVDRVFPIDDAAAAHRALDEHHARGKLVLQISDG